MQVGFRCADWITPYHSNVGVVCHSQEMLCNDEEKVTGAVVSNRCMVIVVLIGAERT
jgi:hypothetical protein